MLSIIDTIDPNWFYSACAQSSAAIVGLMGAFIVTKLVNQKSYIVNLKKEALDINHEIRSLDEMITSKLEAIEELDLADKPMTANTMQNFHITNKRNTNHSKYSEYTKDIDEFSTRKLFYQERLKVVQKAVNSNRDLYSLTLNLVLLLIFSMVGVFWPLYALLVDIEKMIKYRNATFFLIGLGWAVILLHFAVDLVLLMKNAHEVENF